MGKSKSKRTVKRAPEAMEMRSFRVSPAMWARAKALAKRQRTDTSALVRKALGAALERG